jgi:hypothetical protein
MTEPVDIIVFGTGSFAARIVFDIAATADHPVRVAVAGRNAERLSWLKVAGNARASVFGRSAIFTARHVDLAEEEAAQAVIAELRPSLVVQAASSQPSSVIATQGDAWSRLVAEGGLSATAVFQARLSLRVARAIQSAHPDCRLVNCCFPDVVNPLLASAGLPIFCGVGNVAILANAFAGELGIRQAGRLKVLAAYQTIAPWRRPKETRSGSTARVWLDDEEVADVYARFAAVRITPEPAIEISGAGGVPLMLAVASGGDWRGHVPGPLGLPGGYPVSYRAGVLDLDLPSSISREEAVAWNARFEEANGLSVGADGRARYTGALYDRLREVTPELAEGFAVAELDEVHEAMGRLRARLQAAR